MTGSNTDAINGAAFAFESYPTVIHLGFGPRQIIVCDISLGEKILYSNVYWIFV